MTELVLIRHGESTANVAREASEAAGHEQIPVECRDADVPLSELGQRQAGAVGQWLRAQPVCERAWCSPYVRAAQTAQLALQAGESPATLKVDERLRDKELGVLDTLTTVGVAARYPLEAERKRWLGKLYYRAPGGESWADVALRIRSFLRDVESPRRMERSIIFTHDAVITLFRYVCLEMSEAEVLEVAQAEPVPNASITVLALTGDRWSLRASNLQDHLVTADGEDLRTLHTGETDVAPR
jgi:probable phosphoglycerate mutase